MRKLFLIIAVSLVFLFLTSFQSFAQCEGDFDCDGDVDGSDLAVFAADFGRTDCTPNGPAPVEKTWQTKCYDTGGTEIPCAGTGQDGDFKMGVEWPNPRFTDNGDGTVTDNLTGLVWLENANCFGERVWSNALSDCNGLASESCGLIDGSSAGDWRLPNVKELHSLIHYGVYNPALSDTAGTGQWTSGDPFTNVQSWCYWSATTCTSHTGNAWNVEMHYGMVSCNGKPNDNYYVWPVRAGQ